MLKQEIINKIKECKDMLAKYEHMLAILNGEDDSNQYKEDVELYNVVEKLYTQKGMKFIDVCSELGINPADYARVCKRLGKKTVSKKYSAEK